MAEISCSECVLTKKATDRTGVYRTVTSPLKQFRTVHECSFTQTNNHSLEEHSEDVLVRFAYTRTTPCHHLNSLYPHGDFPFEPTMACITSAPDYMYSQYYGRNFML